MRTVSLLQVTPTKPLLEMASNGNPESHPALAPKPTVKDYRTYVALICAIFSVGSNVAIILCWVHELHFGTSITDGRWRYIDDGNAIALLGFWAQFLQIITVVLGGWAVAQMWARRSVNEGASIVGLQSLGVFSSLGSLLLAYWHIWKRRYPRSSLLFLYIPLIICATLLQYYATAVLTLIVPTFHEVTEPRSIPAQTLPYMSEPAASTPCMNLTGPSLEDCLGNWYSQVTTGNILIFGTTSPSSATFDGEQLPPAWRPIWGVTGPDMTSIALLTRPNPSVIFGVAASRDFTDSIAFSANIPAIIPTITTQCAMVNQTTNVTQVNIADVRYQVPLGIPVLPSGSLAGQLTTNNSTLLITYSTNTPSTNVHCALNLSLSDGSRSTVALTSIANQTGRFADYFGQDPDILNSDGTLGKVNFWPVGLLASLWLRGMGWSAVPANDALSRYLSTLDLTVGTKPHFTNRNVLIANTYEAYTLFLLAGNIDVGFPPWRNDTSNTLQQTYQLHKTQLLTGARTVSRYIALVVVGLDILFVLWSTGMVVFGGGWLPDWSDPAVLICTALASKRNNIWDDSSRGEIQENAWKRLITYRTESDKTVGGARDSSEPLKPFVGFQISNTSSAN
ncbi:hypothetical protein QCA50_015281 [Cerrena zonata]|uniref:Uncharacterized protein n=1 Tax=Cerrena zonata TaxID=2478898 RepID=A0AAW0FTH4_9APHY